MSRTTCTAPVMNLSKLRLSVPIAEKGWLRRSPRADDPPVLVHRVVLAFAENGEKHLMLAAIAKAV